MIGFCGVGSLAVLIRQFALVTEAPRGNVWGMRRKLIMHKRWLMQSFCIAVIGTATAAQPSFIELLPFAGSHGTQVGTVSQSNSPGRAQSISRSISSDGNTIVGTTFFGHSGASKRVIRWVNGRTKTILPGIPGQIDIQPYYLSADGARVVGLVHFASGPSRVFIWNDLAPDHAMQVIHAPHAGGVTLLGATADCSTVVILCHGPSGANVGFQIVQGDVASDFILLPPDYMLASLAGISDDGNAVYFNAWCIPSSYHCGTILKWTPQGGFVQLLVPPSAECWVAGEVFPGVEVVLGQYRCRSTDNEGPPAAYPFAWNSAIGFTPVVSSMWCEDFNPATYTQQIHYANCGWTYDPSSGTGTFTVRRFVPSRTEDFECSIDGIGFGNGSWQSVDGETYALGLSNSVGLNGPDTDFVYWSGETIVISQLIESSPVSLRSYLDAAGLDQQTSRWEWLAAAGVSGDGSTIFGLGSANPRVDCVGVGWVARLDGTPLQQQSRCFSLNCDDVVDAADLSIFLANFGGYVASGAVGDYNDDGIVNAADLSVFLAQFGRPCLP